MPANGSKSARVWKTQSPGRSGGSGFWRERFARDKRRAVLVEMYMQNYRKARSAGRSAAIAKRHAIRETVRDASKRLAENVHPSEIQKAIDETLQFARQF